jgi:hypothetical protein
MMPTEQENFDQRSQEGRLSTPKPDPTVLTTEMTMREIAALRTLIGERISATEKLFDTKIQLGREGGMALKELFAIQFTDLKDQISANIEARSELLQENFDGRDKALVAALQAAKEAVDKANEATEKRFDALNEVLSGLNGVIALLIPRAEAESRMSDLDRRIGDVKEAVDKGFTGVNVRDATGREVVSSTLENRADQRANYAIIIAVVGTLATMALILVTQFHR